MHALVIDDSRATRLILGSILKKIGFEVTEAGNGREGLEQLRRLGNADLALVDWHMPDMDGLGFVRAVRAEPDFRELRVVMVTGQEEPAQAAEARDAGANAYLTKPFTKEDILAKLALLGLSPC